MEIKNRNELKEYFKAYTRPTEAQFANLIDSLALKSELISESSKPYKVFSALLRIENVSLNKPKYVLNYSLLEENTIGELNIYLGKNYELIFEDESGEGKLNFERRFITVGALRDDFNFDTVIEIADNSNDYLKLSCTIKDDGISLPEAKVPLFYNLPIEIKIYEEMKIELPFPDGSLPDPTKPLYPSNPEVKS